MTLLGGLLTKDGAGTDKVGGGVLVMLTKMYYGVVNLKPAILPVIVMLYNPASENAKV